MANAEIGSIIGNRYRINRKLGEGGMGIVFEATDRLNRVNVALKQVFVNAPHAVRLNSNEIDYRIALAHEFETMASLRHPNIISVLDYGFDDDQQPYYTMELLVEAKKISLYAQPLELSAKVAFLVQLLQALTYLHRRGVFHRDVKPDNVLVTSDGLVKVLDFGLALVKNEADPTQNATGTLAYMAPETLQGLPATQATDLYAVGVIAYEMIVGKHPFNVKDINGLIHDVMTKIPDFAELDIESDITMIIERLMAKMPEDRYQSAPEVIEALSTVTNQPIPLETQATRESFLQSADFIGRTLELQQLTDRLDLALRGSGQAVLVGGESGVGKSRLLEELRTLALVRGASVVRGQGISEGGSPYALWRDTLRWLVLLNDNDITDLEASVLKPLISDIEELLDRPVADPPELSPQAMQARMINVLESLFERHPSTKPMVVVFEDLHWAGSESLKALEHLVASVARMPVLIVASYRDDEFPTLPDVLDMPLVSLKPLTVDEISALTVSMLGEAGERTRVVDLLQRETDGNIFFLIEVVRALAEEAGSLSSIGLRTIPAQVFAGGLRTIIQRRLEKVPTMMRDLMRQASVLGRQIDLKLVTALNKLLPNFQQVDIDAWLTILADAAILNVVDNQWQFAHDKLREGLVMDLTPIELHALHRRAAEAISVTYGEQAEYTVKLAFHWRRAGDVNKELVYMSKAGEQTLDNGAYQEAIEYLQRALEIAGTSKLTPLRRATLKRKLSAAYLAMGNLADAAGHIREALQISGYPVPQEQEVGRKLLRQLLRQVAHRILPFAFVGRKTSDSDYQEFIEAAAAHEQLQSLSYYTNQSSLGLYATLRMLNLSEMTRPSIYLGPAFSGVSYVSMLVSQRVSNHFYNHAIRAAYHHGVPSSIARTHQVAAIRYVSIAQWQKAEDELQKALQTYEDLGDLRLWTNGTQTLGEVYYYRGEFRRSMEVRKSVYDTALRYGDIQTQGFGLRGQAMNLVILGELDNAEQFAQSAVSRYSASNDQIGETDSWGILALVNLRQNRPRRAYSNAQRVADLTLGRAPTSYNLLIAYYSAAEVFLSLYEQDDGSEREKLETFSLQMLDSLKQYAKRFQIGQPRMHLYHGRWQWLKGNHSKAKSYWQKGIAIADKYHMPYDRALLDFEMGSRMEKSSPEREALLKHALDAFMGMEAMIDVERVQALLT